jgi:NAD(P)-dependent dehydrogenase (short-subunit alcohol dehydrogenase family)
MSTRTNSPLDGKVAVVTGVSSGLGRVLAKAFAAAGARVVGAARRADLGSLLEHEVREAGRELVFVEANIQLVEDCKRIVDAAVDRYGRLDILVNNAAVRSKPPLVALHEVGEATWDEVMDTNLKGAFFCTRFAVAVMRRQQSGTILNIASYTGDQATSGMSPYGISKAGLIQLARAVAVEYSGDNVKANAIILGSTATGQAKRTSAAWEEFWASRGESPPIPVAGVRQDRIDAEAVARALVLLCHPDAAVVTGASIAIDLGVSAGLYTSRYTHQMIAATHQE